MKNLIYSACFFTVALQASSLQAQFSTPEVVLPASINNHLTDLQAADLSGNGFLDLVGKKDNMLAYYENLGEAQFEEFESLLTIPLNIQQFLLIDTENDGSIDIWVSTTAQSALYTNEDGAFVLSQTFPAGGSIVRSYDMDGDGYQDVIAFTGGTFRIYLNDGEGGFALHSTNVIDIQPRDIAFTDVDGDGFTDLVFNHSAWSADTWSQLGGAGYTLNDGNHNFSETEVLVEGIAIEARSIKVVDFDLDGNEDILVLFSDMNWDWDCPSSQTTLLLFENNGNGDYTEVNLGLQTRPYFRQMHIADINGDGYPDILANFSYTNASSEQCQTYREGVQMMINNGDGTATNQFLSDNSNFFQCLPYSGQQALLADISGNGNEEMIFSNPQGDTYGNKSPSYISTHNGNLGTGMQAMYYINPDCSTLGMDAMDINGDGKFEIAHWNKEALNFNLTRYDRTAAEEYESDQLELSTSVFCNFSTRISSLAVGDLDGDGLSDVVYSRTNSNIGFELLARTSDGTTLGSEQSITMINASMINNNARVYLVDLDGDGNDEVVVAITSTHTIHIFKRTEAGTFETLGESFSVQGTFASLSFGDVNGDGFMDISTIRNGNSLRIFLGDGAGGSTGIVDIPLADTGAIQHEFIDLNNDGYPELVTWSTTGNMPLRVYMNSAGSSLGAGVIIKPTGSYSRFVHFADLYNNGIPQMIYYANQAEVRWMDNDGNGNLGNEVTLFSGPQAADVRYVTTGDFNGNGATDITLVRSYGFQNQNSEILLLPSIMVPGTTVNGFVYFDQNENGLYDEGDLPAAFVPVGVQENDALTYTLPNGNFFLADLGAGELSIQPMLNDALWAVSSTPSVYAIELTEDNNYSASNIDFGLVPVIAIDSLSLDVTQGNLRCNESSLQWITVQNKGTTAIPSQLLVQIDPETVFLSSIPDAVDVIDNMVYIDIPELLPFAYHTAVVTLLGPNENLTGEVLDFQAEISVGGNVLDSIMYSNEVSCAYDPNDKLENNGWTEEGFVLEGTPLEYTIRFQNTGNDVAMNVRLEDQLSSQLQWGSFEAVAWSHTPTIQLSSQGRLTVFFNDIMLPDSGASWIESQGFFKFRIWPEPGLAVGTVINNTAEIYFDFNAPIITNTTINTIYGCDGLADFSTSALEVCEGSGFEFESTMPHIVSYSWMVNAEASGDGPMLLLNELAAGAYSVMLTVQNPLCLEQSEVALTVHPAPEAQIEADMADLTAVGSFATYQWYLDGVPIDGANAPAHTALANGTYTVEVTDVNGCLGVSAPFLFNSLNTQDGRDGRTVAVYPVPTSGMLTIDLGADTQHFTGFKLIDALGQVCVSKAVTSARMETDLGNLSNGHYILLLTREDGTVHRTTVMVVR